MARRSNSKYGQTYPLNPHRHTGPPSKTSLQSQSLSYSRPQAQWSQQVSQLEWDQQRRRSREDYLADQAERKAALGRVEQNLSMLGQTLLWLEGHCPAKGDTLKLKEAALFISNPYKNHITSGVKSGAIIGFPTAFHIHQDASMDYVKERAPHGPMSFPVNSEIASTIVPWLKHIQAMIAGVLARKDLLKRLDIVSTLCWAQKQIGAAIQRMSTA